MSTPGMIYPTQKGMLAGNPRDSAITQMNNTNATQTSLTNAVGGKKHKYKKTHRKRKGGSTIAVPQYTMLYTSQNGPGTDPNSQIKTNSQISTQGTANAVYDQQATVSGGYRNKNSKRKRKHHKHSSKGGNNPNWHWPCSSGGKRKTKKRKY